MQFFPKLNVNKQSLIICTHTFIKLKVIDAYWYVLSEINALLISSSEWTTAIKLSSNTAAVRSVPGRSTNTIKVRFPDCNEVETLGHVLGFCPKGELLRTRHHRVRSTIASSLRDTGMKVYEEVHCLADDGSTRRVDILAIDKQEKKAVILDPTVGFEQGIQQAMVVDEEKQAIYLPCIPHSSERYKATLYMDGIWFALWCSWIIVQIYKRNPYQIQSY